MNLKSSGDMGGKARVVAEFHATTNAEHAEPLDRRDASHVGVTSSLVNDLLAMSRAG